MAIRITRVKRFFQVTWKVLRLAVTDYFRDHAPLLGAGVSFWAVLSLSPLLVVVVIVVSWVYDGPTAQMNMVKWLEENVGGQAADAIISALEHASAPGATTLPGLISLALMLWGASRFFHALQLALNQVWNVQPKRRVGVGRLVLHVARKRALTFALLMVFSLLLLASLAVGTVLPIVQGRMTSIPGAFHLYRVLEVAISTVIVSIGVGLVYLILPDIRIPWRYVWRGALVTGFQLILCRMGLAWYLGRQSLGSSYGAAGSLTALLLWIYTSTQFFFFGAELTQAYARIRGVRQDPEPEYEWIRRPRTPTGSVRDEPDEEPSELQSESL